MAAFLQFTSVAATTCRSYWRSLVQTPLEGIRRAVFHKPLAAPADGHRTEEQDRSKETHHQVEFPKSETQGYTGGYAHASKCVQEEEKGAGEELEKQQQQEVRLQELLAGGEMQGYGEPVGDAGIYLGEEGNEGNAVLLQEEEEEQVKEREEEQEKEQTDLLETQGTAVSVQEHEYPPVDCVFPKDATENGVVKRSKFWGLLSMNYQDIVGVEEEEEDPVALDLMDIESAEGGMEEQESKCSDGIECPRESVELGSRKRGITSDSYRHNKKSRVVLALPTIEESPIEEFLSSEVEIPPVKFPRIEAMSVERRKLVAEKLKLPYAPREAEFYFAGRKRKRCLKPFSPVVRKMFDDFNLKLQGLEVEAIDNDS